MNRDDEITVPAEMFNQMKASADRLPLLAEHEAVLRQAMGRANAKPMVRKRKPVRELTPQEKANRAKRKAVRRAQREARRVNRRKR